jgi:hypothetical protein
MLKMDCYLPWTVLLKQVRNLGETSNKKFAMEKGWLAAILT